VSECRCEALSPCHLFARSAASSIAAVVDDRALVITETDRLAVTSETPILVASEPGT
jgi:hypothetical protein